MNLGPPITKHMQVRAAVLQELDKRFQPHRGQLVVMHAYYVLGCKFIFIQCGRKWGKTELELRIGVENCLLPVNDGLTTLYCAYEDEQAQNIVWNEGRLLKFLHPDWISNISETDMRIDFRNKRMFQVDGSNNYKKREGERPSLLLNDEFKRFRPEYWDVVEPNLSVYDAAVIFAGSPPEGPCQYTEIADFVKKLQATTGEGFFTQQPSWMNDKTPGLISWLHKRKSHYEASGRMDVWDREYGAIYTRSGTRLIFPEFRRERVQRSEDFIREHVLKTIREWDFYCCADPATGDPFAVLFAAIHRTTKHVAILDLIYETDRHQKAIVNLWPQIQSKIERWNPNYDDWQFIQDDQNAWWGLEFQSQIPDGPKKPAWTPAGKQTRMKDTGLGIINGIIARDLLWVNEKLEKFFWEHSQYQTDETGKIKKGNDHSIDDFRYILYFSNYDINLVPEEKIPDEYLRDPWIMKQIRAQEGFEENEDLEEDWTRDMFADWAGIT